MYFASVVWSTSTAWRWVKVPRPESWPRQPHRRAFGQQRAEGQRLAGRPVDVLAGLDRLALLLELARDLAVEVEVLGRLGDARGRPPCSCSSSTAVVALAVLLARRDREARPTCLPASRPCWACSLVAASSALSSFSRNSASIACDLGRASPRPRPRAARHRPRFTVLWPPISLYISGWVNVGSSDSLWPCRR